MIARVERAAPLLQVACHAASSACFLRWGRGQRLRKHLWRVSLGVCRVVMVMVVVLLEGHRRKGELLQRQIAVGVGLIRWLLQVVVGRHWVGVSVACQVAGLWMSSSCTRRRATRRARVASTVVH